MILLFKLRLDIAFIDKAKAHNQESKKYRQWQEINNARPKLKTG
jgi:hypothetical protein